MTRPVADFLAAVGTALGPEHVDSTTDTLAAYGRSELPTGACVPAGVLYPGSTEDVQRVVQLANERGVALHPISTGQNLGMGGRVAVGAGAVIVDLGRRMNRILEFDDRLEYVVVEPGVTYQALADFLVDQGDRLMVDTTSGPPEGSPLGNTMDKGAGYTPAADHFAHACGLEVVLGDGRVLRTADGALPGSNTWHLARYGFGPFLDGLFLQSNFGIVTRMGLWLIRRPPVIRSFFFMFPDADDIGEIVEIVRELKLGGVVPTAIKATGDLYALASQLPRPGRDPLDDDARRALHAEHGIGTWIVSGALYGADEAQIAPVLARVRARFEASGKARYVAHEEAVANPMLKIHVDTYSGRPTAHEVAMVDWRGGGIVSITPATPMIGAVAAEHQRISRGILARHGLDTCIDYIFAGRASRALHSILFDPDDADQCAAVRAASRELADTYAALGYPCGRVPTYLQAGEMSRRDESFRGVLDQVKHAMDPRGILTPGRYGIG